MQQQKNEQPNIRCEQPTGLNFEASIKHPPKLSQYPQCGSRKETYSKGVLPMEQVHQDYLCSNDRLSNLVRWKDYALRHRNFWSTEHSARHFLNTRKSQLIALDILIRTTSGWMVDSMLLDKNLIALQQMSPDQEQFDLPLESDMEGDVK